MQPNYSQLRRLVLKTVIEFLASLNSLGLWILQHIHGYDRNTEKRYGHAEVLELVLTVNDGIIRLLS